MGMNVSFKTRTGIFLLAMMGIMYQCTYKNSQDVYPDCVTTNMSNKNDIIPIFTANHCYDCHSNATASLGGGEKNVMVYYWQVERFVNDSTGDILYGMVADPRDSNFNHMPQGPYPHLSNCEISKVYAWIQQGAKNN